MPRRWCQPRQAVAANQQGQGIGNFFMVAKKYCKSKIAHNIGKKALEYLPDVYGNSSRKIKNKKTLKKYLIQITHRYTYGSSYGQNKLE